MRMTSKSRVLFRGIRVLTISTALAAVVYGAMGIWATDALAVVEREPFDAPVAEPFALVDRTNTVAALPVDDGAVLAHNPFCPGCVEAGQGAGGSSPVAPNSDALAGLRLLATMVSEDPARSLATITDANTGTVAAFAVGETVASGYVVASIESGRVGLRRDRVMAYLELGAAVDAATEATRSSEAVGANRSRGADSRLRREGPGRCTATSRRCSESKLG